MRVCAHTCNVRILVNLKPCRGPRLRGSWAGRPAGGRAAAAGSALSSHPQCRGVSPTSVRIRLIPVTRTASRGTRPRERARRGLCVSPGAGPQASGRLTSPLLGRRAPPSACGRRPVCPGRGRSFRPVRGLTCLPCTGVILHLNLFTLSMFFDRKSFKFEIVDSSLCFLLVKILTPHLTIFERRTRWPLTSLFSGCSVRVRFGYKEQKSWLVT